MNLIVWVTLKAKLMFSLIDIGDEGGHKWLEVEVYIVTTFFFLNKNELVINLNNSININVLRPNNSTSEVICIKRYAKEVRFYLTYFCYILIIHNNWFYYDISMHLCKVFWLHLPPDAFSYSFPIIPDPLSLTSLSPLYFHVLFLFWRPNEFS